MKPKIKKIWFQNGESYYISINTLTMHSIRKLSASKFHSQRRSNKLMMQFKASSASLLVYLEVQRALQMKNVRDKNKKGNIRNTWRGKINKEWQKWKSENAYWWNAIISDWLLFNRLLKNLKLSMWLSNFKLINMTWFHWISKYKMSHLYKDNWFDKNY